MDINFNRKCAYILIKTPYASSLAVRFSPMRVGVLLAEGRTVDVDITKDTAEGYRQAHAVENWLHQNHQALLIKCKEAVPDDALSDYNGHVKRLRRMKWCVEKL